MRLKSTILDFLEQNKDILENFDNGDLPKDKFIDFDIDNLTKYMEQTECNSKPIQLFIDIIKSCKIYDYRRFIDTFRTNTDHILEIYNMIETIPTTQAYTKVKLNFICNNIPLKKSNFFYLLYSLFLLKEKGLDLNNENVNFYYYIKDIQTFDDDTLNLCIISDDVSYSGSQISNLLIINDPTNFTHEKSPMKIFLNIVAARNTAQNMIRRILENYTKPEDLIYARGVELLTGEEKFDSVAKILKEKLNISDEEISKYGAIDMKKFNSIIEKKIQIYNNYSISFREKKYRNGIVTQIYVSINPSTDLINLDTIQESGIILFQKYPDFISAYQHLCYLNPFTNKYTLNIFNLLEYFQIKIDDIRLLDLLITYKKKNKPIDIRTVLDDLFEISQLSYEVQRTIKTQLRGISRYRNNYENIDKHFIKINKIFNKDIIETCKKPVDVKTIPNTEIISTLFGKYGNFNLDDKNYCNDIIPPFYKKINWISSIPIGNDTRLSDLLSNLPAEESKYYKKYLKYKHKYLQLKNIN